MTHSPLETPPLETQTEWEGRTIRLSYRPEYFAGLAHVEIRSEDGEPLPITETGYRSHFFAADDAIGLKDVETLVRGWLNGEARSKGWRDYCDRSRQMTLF